VGRYRWLGAGDDLINSSRTGVAPFGDGSNAWETLTGGNYQEWEMGLQLNIPIGYRLAMTGVRHHQLLLARARSVLQDMELEVSHQLSDTVRDVDLNYGLTQSNFNRRVAAEDEVDAVEAVYDSGRVTLDLLLDAQRRRADAESLYYRSLVDYNRAIMRVHYRKGSLLEYNGVYLAEGPWPGKAYFDALRLSRRRGASRPLDYGYTRPDVLSRGPAQQRATGVAGSGESEPTLERFPIDEEPIPAGSEAESEIIVEPSMESAGRQPIPLPTGVGLTPSLVPLVGAAGPGTSPTPLPQAEPAPLPVVSGTPVQQTPPNPFTTSQGSSLQDPRIDLASYPEAVR
jgi:hypothetical protein